MMPNATKHISDHENSALAKWIKVQAYELGFADCGIAEPNTRGQIKHLKTYLKNGHQGQMKFLDNHHDKRADPTRLVEGTKSIICVRLDYLTAPTPARVISDNTKPNSAIVARYARGRDYHKVMRNRLKKLALRIQEKIGEDFVWRPFSDSAPIFEKALAENAGLGWTGKHTLLLNKEAGSFFVLGELFTSLDLPFDTAYQAKKSTLNQDVQTHSENTSAQQQKRVAQEPSSHCGSCTACIDICPTQAIIAPYQLDARRCIAYLTIEHQGSIPLEFRKSIGNRVFGCDDCQLICPWNRFAKLAKVEDFNPRNGLDHATLLELFDWSEKMFEQKMLGSPIRRTGYEGFLRNIAIGLGNAPANEKILNALQEKLPQVNDMVAEHISWAIDQQIEKIN